MNDKITPSDARSQELENLYSQLAQSATRLMVVHEASHILRSSHDPEELAEKLLAVIAEATFAASGCVASLTGDELKILSHRGLEEHEADELSEHAGEAEVWFHVADSEGAQHRDQLLEDLDLGDDDGHVQDEDTGLVDDEDAGPADDEAREELEDSPYVDDDTAEDEPEDEPEAEAEEEEELPDDDEADGVSVRSGAPHFDLYLPLRVEDKVLGVLALGPRVDGKPYGEDEVRLAESLGAHLALALDHAALFAERNDRIEQLSVLLQISKEITSTLDMERVLSTIAHMVGMVLENRRTVVALALDGNVSIRASSEPGFIRDEAKSDPLRPVLEWVFGARQQVNTCRTDLESDTDAEGRAVMLPYLSGDESPRGLSVLPLEDDQGILGLMAIESNDDAIPMNSEHEELMSILANQTTVAIRNAELYQQIPMAGMFRPLLGRTGGGGLRKLLIRGGIAVVVLGFGFLVPLPAWVSGDANLRPASQVPVRAGTQGSLDEVLVSEGQMVESGTLLARLRADELNVQLEQTRAGAQKARSAASTARMRGDLGTFRAEQAKLNELFETEEFLNDELSRTEIRAPIGGIVLSPDLHLRLGSWLARGQTFLDLADLTGMEVQVAVPEVDVHRLREGGSARFKVHSFPNRTFRGEVSRIAPAADAGGTFRILVLVDNEDGSLRPGMTGRAHLATPAQPIFKSWFRGLGRGLRLKFWF